MFKISNFNKRYDSEFRDKLRFDLKTSSDFNSFLFNEVKNYLPRSYLENYKIFLKNHRKIFKKKDYLSDLIQYNLMIVLKFFLPSQN